MTDTTPATDEKDVTVPESTPTESAAATGGETMEQVTVPAPSAEPTETADPNARATQNRKTRQGYVVSDKMDKTVVVLLEDRVKHALYGKVMRRTNRVKAHDEANEAGVGDRVLIMETRPLSATKHWRVVEILEKAK